MPPSFYSVSDADQLAFFLHAADAAQLPVMLYNFPELTGNRIAMDTIAAFGDRAPMVAIKQSGREFEYHNELIALGREKGFVVFSGADTRLPEVFALGFRNALLVGLAIPLSMLVTFVAVQMTGTTLNMVVLFSLILAVGMLVDNAVVVIENIYRHRQEGKSAIEAARAGTHEVGSAIVVSTLTTVGAFFPLLFWPGVVGDFMQYLPLTVIIALSASLLVGLTVVLKGVQDDRRWNELRQAEARLTEIDANVARLQRQIDSGSIMNELTAIREQDGNDVVLTKLAANRVWSGLGVDDNWTTAANWPASTIWWSAWCAWMGNRSRWRDSTT